MGYGSIQHYIRPKHEHMPDLKNIRPGMPCLQDDPFLDFWNVISGLIRNSDMTTQLEEFFLFSKSRTSTPKKA